MAMPSSLQIFPVPENSVNCRLVFSDTDSLCYHIHIATADLYWDLAAIKDHLDTSNYPKASENDVMIALYSPRNAKVLGKFKDECNGTAPLEFVGLRAKMYSLQISRRQTKTTTKGIKKSFIKKHVTHQMFLHTLLTTNDISGWTASRLWHTDTIASRLEISFSVMYILILL